MAKVTHCEICGKKFKWYRWRYECKQCGKNVCGKCLKTVRDINIKSKTYGKRIFLCKDCYDNLQREYKKAKDIIVVRSSHVGGHKTIRILGEISTGIAYEDFDDAKFELQYNTLKMGGNAILNYKYIRHKYSQITDGGGTYYYSLFTARGTVAVVEKIQKSQKRVAKKTELGES